MKLLRLSGSVLLLLLAACEHGGARSAVDSSSVVSSSTGSDSSSASVAGSNWDSGAGPVLLVATDTASIAGIILPDATGSSNELSNIPSPASVTLFGRGGTVQSAVLPTIVDSGSCIVATLSAAPPPEPWSIGFIGGVVSPIPMDSTASLSAADSAALGVDLIRLASALPNDSAGRFTGLPFTVRTLWRFKIPNGDRVVAANLTREINQEATPLQEHTLLVAESTPTDSALATTFSERSYGMEDSVENFEVVAGALLGAAHTPSLVLSRDYGDSISYELIERDDKGRWRTRWTSARRSC